MERKIEKKLHAWKTQQKRKALMIRGPRQVGKSYTIREFGKKNYRKVIEINFEDNPEFKTVFEDNLSADKIFLTLSYMLEGIESFNDCLLFLDEIQGCEGALSAVKPLVLDGRCDIICSGSQLGNTICVERLTPIGSVEIIHMEPMDFEEFLWAMGFSHDKTDEIREHIKTMKPFDRSVLRILNNLFLRYVTIGGMPEAVESFVRTELYSESYKIQSAIFSLLRDDILRYGENSTDKDRISQCISSIPRQLSRESGNSFHYSDVSMNAKYGRREYGASISWLINAGFVDICYNLEEISEPFVTKADGNTFKIYVKDTGMMTLMLGPEVGRGIVEGDFKINNGALIENAIASALVKNGYRLHYYSNPVKRVEIDFVVNLNGRLTAIEVKSGRKKSARSLNKLVEIGQDVDVRIKISDSNLSVDENGIYHIPLFGASFFDECVPLELPPLDISDLLDGSRPLS